jgi:hypothetical protein
VAGGWRRLHNEELHNFHNLPHIIRVTKSRRMRWAGHLARMGEIRKAYHILVVTPEGRRSLGSVRSRWKDIKIDRMHLAQDRGQW